MHSYNKNLKSYMVEIYMLSIEINYNDKFKMPEYK